MILSIPIAWKEIYVLKIVRKNVRGKIRARKVGKGLN
jgi:hypothetical protein